MQVLIRYEQRRNFQCAVVPADVELHAQPAIQVVITRHFPSVAVKLGITMQEGITAEGFEPWGFLRIRERRQEQNRAEDKTWAHRISSRTKTSPSSYMQSGRSGCGSCDVALTISACQTTSPKTPRSTAAPRSPTRDSRSTPKRPSAPRSAHGTSAARTERRL